MKKTSLYNITALFSLLVLSIPNNKVEFIIPVKTSEACQIENVSFQPGEEIVYKIYYNWNFVWLTAGEVKFRVEDAGDEYHLSVTGRSYKSYEWFYRVRDRYDTYIDKKTLLPRLSTKKIEEGSYRLYDKTVLNQETGNIVSWRGKNESKTDKHEFDVNECMHDMLSIVYHARNINFGEYEEGQEFPIKIFMDKTIYPLNVKYLGKETEKKIKGVGKFNTIKFSPQVVAGEVFTENDQMEIWITNDKNRIPVLIESPLSVGSIKAMLKSHKGLKHDFEAKLE